MKIIIKVSEPIKKVQEFQEYDLGQITTTLQDLLDNSSIIVDSNIIPVLKVLTIDNVVKLYLIKDLNESIYNTTDYITGQDLIEEHLLLITGDNQNSGSTVNTAFANKTYLATMSVPFDSANPNIEIDLTGNLNLTVTGTTNGDSGMVNLYFSGTEVATINGIKGLVLTGTGVMIPIYFIHDSDGIKWYDAREAVNPDSSLYSKYIIKDTTPSAAHTGTTAETIIKSYLIPANTFSADDILDIKSFMFQKTTAIGNLVVRLYVNSSVTLAEARQLMYRSDGGTTIFTNYNRTFVINGGLIKGYPATATSYGDVSGSTVAMSSSAFNPSIDNYIFFTIQLSSVSDNAINHSFIVTN